MFYTRKDEKEIYRSIGKVEDKINELRGNQSKGLAELHDLLVIFGIYRGCSNCKHDQHCVVQGDKCNAWNVEHYGIPKNQTLCSEKYWELKGV
jgi:hypothetical protein